MNTRSVDRSGPPVRLGKTAPKQGGNYSRCRAAWKLDWPITSRSQVQILPPQPMSCQTDAVMRTIRWKAGHISQDQAIGQRALSQESISMGF